MPQLIQFDNLGLVEFPDDATDAQITAELTANKDRYRKTLTQAQIEMRSGPVEPATGLESLSVTAQLGFKQLGNILDSFAAQQAHGRRNELDRNLTKLREFEAEFPEGTPDPQRMLQRRRDDLLGAVNAANNETLRAQSWTEQAAKGIAERAPELAALEQAQSPVMQEFNRAEGWDALGVLAKHPAEVLANVITQSMVTSAPALGLGALGGVAGGPGGSAAGVAEGSFLTEFGAKVGDELQKELTVRGTTMEDLPAVQSLLQDREFMDRTRNKAAAKGVPVALMDALTAGLAGKFLGPALRAGGKARIALAGAKEGVMQSAGGAIGEAGGELAAGEKLSVKDIALEAIAELPGGVRETIQNVRRARSTAGSQSDRAAYDAAVKRAAAQTLALQQSADNLQKAGLPATADAVRQQAALVRPVLVRPVLVRPVLEPGADQPFELPVQEKPADVAALMEEARKNRAANDPDKPPPPREHYAGMLQEEGDWTLDDAVKMHGRPGAPKIEDAMAAMDAGKTARQVVAEWSGGAGEADSLSGILEEVHAAHKIDRRLAAYKQLVQAYKSAFNQGGKPLATQAIQNMQDAQDAGDGFNPAGGIPSDPADLYHGLWQLNLNRWSGEKDLSPGELTLHFHDVLASRVGRSATQNGGHAVDVDRLQPGDKFKVRGTELAWRS